MYIIIRRVGFTEKNNPKLWQMSSAEVVLKSNKIKTINHHKRRNGINRPNCKSKLMFWPGRGWRNPACISGELSPSFLFCAVLLTSTFVKKVILTLLQTRLTHKSTQASSCKAHRNCWCFSRNPLGFPILPSLDSSTWAVSYRGDGQWKNVHEKQRSSSRNTTKQTAPPSHVLLQQVTL